MTTSKMRQNVIMKLRQEEVDAVHDWQELDMQIKKLTADRDAIVQRFKARMEAEHAEVCTFRNMTLVTRRETKRDTIDSTRLRTEKPEIAQEYTKTSVSWKPAYVS